MKKLSKSEKLRVRVFFADWWYFRTETLLTSKRGEAAFLRLLDGKTIRIKRESFKVGPDIGGGASMIETGWNKIRPV